MSKFDYIIQENAAYITDYSYITDVLEIPSEVDGYPVYSVFSKDDIPNFTLSDPDDCPDCKAGKKLDAVVNSYGYELL